MGADGEVQRLLELAGCGRLYGTAYAALQSLMSENGLSAEDGQCLGLVKVCSSSLPLFLDVTQNYFSFLLPPPQPVSSALSVPNPPLTFILLFTTIPSSLMYPLTLEVSDGGDAASDGATYWFCEAHAAANPKRFISASTRTPPKTVNNTPP